MTEITDKINTVFERSELECSIIAQSVKVDEELKQRALENGISVGKMYLVDKMVGGMEDLKEEDISDLTDMSIKELNLMYSTRPDNDGDDLLDRDISTGNVGGYVKQDDALTILLSSLEIDSANVEWYEVKAKFQNNNNGRQMVYSVSIKFKNDNAKYELEVDCLTGEVVKVDSNMSGINTPEFNGGDEQAPNNDNDAPQDGDRSPQLNDENEGPPIGGEN